MHADLVAPLLTAAASQRRKVGRTRSSSAARRRAAAWRRGRAAAGASNAACARPSGPTSGTSHPLVLRRARAQVRFFFPLLRLLHGRLRLLPVRCFLAVGRRPRRRRCRRPLSVRRHRRLRLHRRLRHHRPRAPPVHPHHPPWRQRIGNPPPPRVAFARPPRPPTPTR